MVREAHSVTGQDRDKGKERKGKEEYRKTVKVEFKRKWGLLCLTRAL